MRFALWLVVLVTSWGVMYLLSSRTTGGVRARQVVAPLVVLPQAHQRVSTSSVEQSVALRYELYNASDRTLHLLDPEKSCNCVDAHVELVQIPPGGRTIAWITSRVPISGVENGAVTIAYADSHGAPAGTVRLSYEVEVARTVGIQVIPPRLSLEDDPRPGRSWTFTVIFTGLGTPIGETCSDPFTLRRVLPWTRIDESSHTTAIQLSAEVPERELSSGLRLVIQTDLGESFDIEIEPGS